ncbi:MAG: ROK family transcriptional regulator [Arenicella sp.]
MKRKSLTNTNQGTNQSIMRAYNERLILSIIRNHGSLAKADIAKITKLSAQTISVIMRELESDGFLLRGTPLRKGKVGQPLVPMKLNPDGAFFFGLKIGRSSAQLVLIDFLGHVRTISSHSYLYPSPDDILSFTRKEIKKITQTLSPEQQDSIAGLGVTLPFNLWSWSDIVGAPIKNLEAWKHTDIQGLLSRELDCPVLLQNDATAACGAELIFGNKNNARDFVYFYIGYFIGGGIVIDGNLFSGRTGNAGALGSMPIVSKEGSAAQLIDIASIKTLESSLTANGHESDWLWQSPEEWPTPDDTIKNWINETGKAIAYAIASSSTVIDFETAFIDGWLPENIRSDIVQKVEHHLQNLNIQGLELPSIEQGSIGYHARSIGGASLPLSKFLLGNAPLETNKA